MFQKRVVVTHYGGPEVITIIEEDIPTPKPGEVRVKVSVCRMSWRAKAFIPKRRAYPTRRVGISSEPPIGSAKV
jgi:NADPH:quinone reductase-like Zn-dependent oxidoreductase